MEQPARERMDFLRPLQHRHGPGIDGDDTAGRRGVDPRHVALSLLAAHQPVYALECLEAPRGRRISTSVPSSGRARLTLLEGRLIEAEQALDAIGDVAARKRGAADVTDVLVQLQRIARSLPGKLAPPRSVADLVAVALEVLQDLDASHAAIALEPNGIGDQLMLAEHGVDDEPAPLRYPPQFPMSRIGQSECFQGETSAGKHGLLRLFDAQIHGRMGRRGKYGD